MKKSASTEIQWRVTPEQKARFKRCAAHYDISLSAWLRMVTNRAAAYVESQMKGTAQ